MITFSNPTAVAEHQRRQMLRDVYEAARDVNNADIIALCEELLSYSQSRYLGRHPRWRELRETYEELAD